MADDKSTDRKESYLDRVRRWVQGVLEGLQDALEPRTPVPVPVKRPRR